jgi:uncharacterized membrane protein YgdD (TMEM256/DUF423 family)
MKLSFISVGSLIAALGVIAGAFGAHALKTRIQPEQLLVYETGVRFLFLHAIAIIICGILQIYDPSNKRVVNSAKLFVMGIVLFSGSLFLLSCKDLLGISSWHWLGPVTPAGGLLFISAWLMLAFSFSKKS